MTPAYQFLHAQATRPFVWGQTDCALSLADWWQFLHSADPAEHLRGTYDSAASCERVCGWFSDPVAVVEGCLARVGGARRINQPQIGCVGVAAVQIETRVVPVGAVLVSEGVWGMRSLEDRVTTMNFRAAQPVAMWDVGYAA